MERGSSGKCDAYGCPVVVFKMKETHHVESMTEKERMRNAMGRMRRGDIGNGSLGLRRAEELLVALRLGLDP